MAPQFEPMHPLIPARQRQDSAASDSEYKPARCIAMEVVFISTKRLPWNNQKSSGTKTAPVAVLRETS
jgi:hypothetical protein